MRIAFNTYLNGYKDKYETKMYVVEANYIYIEEGVFVTDDGKLISIYTVKCSHGDYECCELAIARVDTLQEANEIVEQLYRTGAYIN